MVKKKLVRASPRVIERLSNETVRLHDEAEVADVVVTGDFSGTKAAHVEFRGCRIEHAQLTGSNLRSARFLDCIVSDSDLSGVLLKKCSMARVEFHACRLSGLQAPRARFVDVGCFDSKINEANFHMTTWKRAEMSHC